MRCDAYGAGLAVVYGKDMGSTFQEKTRVGAGARLSPMYVSASADYYYELNVSTFTLVPYVLAVIEIPVLSLEANLALSQGAVTPGFRVGIRF